VAGEGALAVRQQQAVGVDEVGGQALARALAEQVDVRPPFERLDLDSR
jgi:hypothetical protein